MVSILDLPLEILHYIFGFLPLSSLHRLGGVSRQLHRLVHQDDEFWRRKVNLELNLILISPERENFSGEAIATKRSNFYDNLTGLVWDPSLHGSKEFYLIYSEEFQNLLKHTRQKLNSRSDFEKLLQRFIPKSFSMKTISFCDPNFSARCALFGPGIESPRTKLIVRRIVNAQDNVFEAVKFVSGLAGGLGSGVKIDFKKTRMFELICLYTNSERIRETRQGANRLCSAYNRLLVRDVDPASEVVDSPLQENVHKLLSTLDAVLFAIDVDSIDDGGVEQLSVCLRELEIMLRGLQIVEMKATPVVILCCSNTQVTKLTEISRHFKLDSITNPWGMFSVNISDMNGLDRALDWVLYHVQKKRADLDYHSSSGKSF